MRDVDLGWLAAILEGEGCFTVSGKPNNKSVRIYLKTTDRDVAERCAHLLNAFHVRAAARRGWTRKQAWEVEVSGHLAVDAMRLVLPEMGKRRTARIRELLTLWDSRPRRLSCVGARRAALYRRGGREEPLA